MLEFPGLPPMTAAEFAGRYDPARLSGLRLKHLAQYNSDLFRSDRYLENIAKQGAIFGYTEQLEFLAVYGFEGINYGHTYTVAHFEKGWQILYLYANMLGSASTGVAGPVDDDFINQILNDSDYIVLE